MSNKIVKRVSIYSYCKKPVKNIQLSGLHNTNIEYKRKLPPVLFHGTTKYGIELWNVNGITNNHISLCGDLEHASAYASYKIEQYMKTNQGDILLTNIFERHMKTFSLLHSNPGLLKEFMKINKGNIFQSIAVFDRDTLLSMKAVDLGFYFDPECIDHNVYAGIIMKWNTNNGQMWRLPFSALICSIDFNSTKDSKINVFNRALWDMNFSVEPKKITINSIKELENLKYNLLP